MSQKISGKKILISGGAGGIGKIIVDSLYKNNEIIIITKNKCSVEGTEKNYSGKVRCYQADVSEYKQIDEIIKEIGKFDALINCAGMLGPIGNIEQIDIENWKETINVNLIGTLNCIKSSIQALKKSSGREGAIRGKIINFSGGGAAGPRIYHSAYACSKAAAVRLTENTAEEFKLEGIPIDINIIAPGAHKTKMWGNEKYDKEPEKWAEPELVIKLVSFLLSDRSNGISGRFFNIKDDYEALDKSISESDLFTLRRIDNFMFKKI